MPGTRAAKKSVFLVDVAHARRTYETRIYVWTGREADAPLRTPRSRQSPFCRNESRPDDLRNKVGTQGRIQTFNLWFVGPALHQLSYSGMNLAVGVGIEPTFRVFQTRANPSQLSDHGAPGRTRTRSFDVRSVALFQLSYRSND